jgi:predicted amidophosphoribosyltransferase
MEGNKMDDIRNVYCDECKEKTDHENEKCVQCVFNDNEGRNKQSDLSLLEERIRRLERITESLQKQVSGLSDFHTNFG